MRLLPTLLLVPVLTLAGAGSASAAAGPVACGDALTRDTTLTSSLDCTGGPGLRIDTPGVTLDLGGFTVSGDTGIGVSVTADRVTVRGGTLQGFPVGVFTGFPDNEVEYAGDVALPGLPHPGDEEPPPAVALQDLRVAGGGGIGVVVAGARTTLTDSVVTGTGLGARAHYQGELVLRGTEVVGNDVGVQTFDGTPVRVQRSLLRDNGVGGLCSQSVLDVSDSAVIGSGIGIDYFQCAGSEVVRSFFSDNDFHLSTDGIPTELPSVGCSVFVLGGPAPDLPGAPCW